MRTVLRGKSESMTSPAETDELLLSLVMPAYNFEDRLEGNIQAVIDALREKGFPFEVILVNDGSRDSTGEKMTALCRRYPELTVLDYTGNRGKGYAVRQGVALARGRYIFFTDIDLPYGLDPVFAGLSELQTGIVDMTLGSRDLPESSVKVSYSPIRQTTKKLFSGLVSRLLKLGIADTQCGLKGFERETAKELFSGLTIDDFSFDVELLYRASRMKKRIRLVPVCLSHSKSSFALLPQSLRMLFSMLRLSLSILLRQYRL